MMVQHRPGRCWPQGSLRDVLFLLCKLGVRGRAAGASDTSQQNLKLISGRCVSPPGPLAVQFASSLSLEGATKVSFSDSFSKAPGGDWEEIPAPDAVAACLATLGPARPAPQA